MLLNFNQICYIYWNFDTSDFISTTIELYCRYTWVSTLQILDHSFLISSCVFCCNCYCLRVIRQIDYIDKCIPSWNKVYIHKQAVFISHCKENKIPLYRRSCQFEYTLSSCLASFLFGIYQVRLRLSSIHVLRTKTPDTMTRYTV